MANEATLTFSSKTNGWTSFWSYYPDWMIGINSTFYTWKDGNLYEHDSSTQRNRFYFDFEEEDYLFYPSSITTVFNQDPLVNKFFKTISLESTDSWDIDVVTDLESGEIPYSYFDEKEGGWFSYIRNLSVDTFDPHSLSTQGIGIVTSFDPLSNMMFFSFDIPSNVSISDKIFKVVGSTYLELGTVSSISGATLTYIQGPLLPPGPSPGDMIFIVKNNVAESYGVRGYYMEVELSNSSRGEVELFEVGTSVFKSYP